MITKSELIILLLNEQNSSFIVQKEEQMKKMPWLVRLKIKQKKCETFILVEHFLWIIFFLFSFESRCETGNLLERKK